MKHETDLQRELLDAWEAWGGWGKKLTNAFTSHIPDLLLVNNIEGVGLTYIVEIKKMEALPVRDTDLVKFAHPLTKGQNQCLIDIRKAGGLSGWWVVYRTYKDDGVYIGHTIDDIPTKQEFISKCLVRKRGQPWTELFPAMVARLSAHI